ncbi:hypothetical protein MHU86_4868 [Fragilaria crotonensis]|nr:hypothetical protein MHU86_4868 [Fragilaria crotonensis]
MTTFILTKVVPNIWRRLPDLTAIVLGKAVLWLVFLSVASDFISTGDRDRVKRELSETGIVIAEGQNPISKVPVLVSGNQGKVFIDEIPTTSIEGDAVGAENENGEPAGETINFLQGPSMRRLNQRLLQNNQASGDQLQNWMLQLQRRFLSLRRENVEIRNDIAGKLQAMERGFHIINGNVRRAALQPARRVPIPPGGAAATAAATAATAAAIAAAAAGADDQGAKALERALLRPALAMTNPATLMPNPRSLHDLWNECLHGVGGRKPARLSPKPSEGRLSISTRDGR